MLAEPDVFGGGRTIFPGVETCPQAVEASRINAGSRSATAESSPATWDFVSREINASSGVWPDRTKAYHTMNIFKRVLKTDVSGDPDARDACWAYLTPNFVKPVFPNPSLHAVMA
jgi:hypothetical protein